MIPYFEITTIDLGGLTINVWGVLVSLGFLTAIIISYREARRQNLNQEYILDLAIVIIIAAILGSRIFYVLNEWEQFRNQPIDIFKIWEGGLAIYGGVIASIIAGWFYLRIRNVSFWKYADVVGFALPLGLAIGRLGCFLIHDHLGKITTVPWGILLANGEIRHETAMYESLMMAGTYVLFIIIKKKQYFKIQPGRLVTLFFLIYGFFRFFSDMLRATDLPASDPVIWLGFRPSQLFSLAMIISAASLLFYWQQKEKSKRLK